MDKVPNGMANGCDGDKTTEERTVNQLTAVEDKMQDLNVIVYCREGSVDDAELKAYLQQFGEVIKFDAGTLQRSVIMRFPDIESKRQVWGKHVIKENTIEVEFKVDADKEEPQEYGIERYFYTPIPEGNSCLLRQVRGYELEVLPKTLPGSDRDRFLDATAELPAFFDQLHSYATKDNPCATMRCAGMPETSQYNVQNLVTVQIITEECYKLNAHDIRKELEAAIQHLETRWTIAVVIPTVHMSPHTLTIVRFSSSCNYQNDPQYCMLMEKVCSTLQQKFNLHL